MDELEFLKQISRAGNVQRKSEASSRKRLVSLFDDFSVWLRDGFCDCLFLSSDLYYRKRNAIRVHHYFFKNKNNQYYFKKICT